MMTTELRDRLLNGVGLCRSNYYPYNIDTARYGIKRKGVKQTVINSLYRIIKYFKLPFIYDFSLDKNTLKCLKYYDFIYSQVDKNSRDVLYWVLLYKLMGYKKVLLPLALTPFRDRPITLLKEPFVSSNFIRPVNSEKKLYKIDLRHLGYHSAVYSSLRGYSVIFEAGQYHYKTETINIKAEEGDVVIEGGACYGNTSIYFAENVGRNGKVYAFEFVKSNIDIFNRQLLENPHIGNIELVPHPMSEFSDKDYYVIDHGPASVITDVEPVESHERVTSLTIDDLVKRKALNSVDFIKMDIEGSELAALKGSEKTLKKFKPKLAIALYHSHRDFEEIPKYIDSLGLDYKFFVGHYTIHSEETMLFCK